MVSLHVPVDRPRPFSSKYCQVQIRVSNPVCINKTVINRDHSSTWLIVGKVGQGMRCSKCSGNSNVLVCETHVKVCICMGEFKSKP